MSLNVQSQSQETKTVLKCTKCGYTEERQFQLGDFVMKIVDKTCPKDGTPLIIWGIYTVRQEQKTK
ncbi:MAG: hypothetical protein L7H21_00955 [Sulfolobales archaeon]|nr:hypothetical protein [Sulfolobales archaeon]MCG2893848.1 hypothetical protein [Sulfolobales archaeon]MCG2910209.1 hypothetical protein [Sulfolobales archaeon]MCQ4343558.1 hypothetical protein [Sulfolobales archaeon]